MLRRNIFTRDLTWELPQFFAHLRRSFVLPSQALHETPTDVLLYILAHPFHRLTTFGMLHNSRKVTSDPPNL